MLTIDVDKLVNDVTKKIFDSKMKEGDIDAKTWLENVQEIWDGTQKGMNKPFVDIKYSDPRFELMTQFKDNIQVFAAFKNHQEVAELVGLLKDDTGAVRSFADFKEEAAKVIGNYNSNYLDSEYNHALASSQMADKWAEFEENKDEFPYLQYNTIGDERVRASHAKLDGITLPIEDEFWNNFMPPNGWKCRCSARQVDDSNEITEAKDLPSFEEVPAVFRNNAAKSGEIFNDSHPYFEGMDADVAERIIKQKNKFVYNDYTSSTYEKLLYDNSTGGYAVKHKKHDGDEANDKTATILAKQGLGVELLKAAKNAPDAIKNGKVWAFEHIKTLEDVEQAMKTGAARAKRILFVTDLDITDAIGESLVKGVKEVAILNGKKLTNIITE